MSRTYRKPKFRKNKNEKTRWTCQNDSQKNRRNSKQKLRNYDPQLEEQ